MSAWIVRPRPNPSARLRLFCFPYAGGGASLFHGWAQALPPAVEVCAVQPPGRESRMLERPLSALADLVSEAAAAMETLGEVPFALFGHSLGALAAFEVARELRRTGRPAPRRLFVSGEAAPHLPARRPPLHVLPDAALVEELRRLGGIPEVVLQSAAMMQLVLPALRADFAMDETYRYREEPPLDVPVSACAGEADSEAPPEDVAEWREHTTADFRTHVFPGNHFFLDTHRDRLLQVLASELAGEL